MRGWLLQPYKALPDNLRQMLRALLGVSALDSVIMGFALAHGYAHFGLPGAMVYLAAQFLIGYAGFWVALVRMRNPLVLGGSVLRSGMLASSLCLAIGALVPDPLLALALFALSGLGRGHAWAERIWLDMHLSHGRNRDSYLSLLHAGLSAFKVVGPALAAGILLLTQDDPQHLFLIMSLGLAVLSWRIRTPFPRPVPGPVQPLAPLLQASYWKNGAFYLLEGSSGALRLALFASGTMYVVGTLAHYGMVEAGASALSALTLVWLARHRGTVNRMTRLIWAMAMTAVAWLALILTTHWPPFLAVFVSGSALSAPLLTAVRHGLVVEGLSRGCARYSPECHMLARETLMLVARVGALLVCAGIATFAQSPGQALQWGAALMLAVMPFEYLAARGMLRPQAAPAAGLAAQSRT